MQPGKSLLYILILLVVGGRLQGALIFEDMFAEPPHAVGTIPSGWTPLGEGTNNDFVSAANLTYPGLAEGAGGSWVHDGSQPQRYYHDFSPAGLAAGQVIYYSFLLQMGSVGKMNPVGYTSAAIMLGLPTSLVPGNGAVASFSFRRDFVDATKFNLGVSSTFRGTGNKGAQVVGLDAWAASGGTAYSEGQTLLLVAEYSYSSATASLVRFWINPDPTTLGADTAPPPTVAMDGKGSAMGSPVQRILVSSVGNTSTIPGLSMSLDAFRVGNTWADVTPKAGPVSYALLDERNHR